MNKLDQLMTEYEPLSAPLSDTELQALKKRVLTKSRPRRKSYKLILAMAAVMCLLAACGAVVIGLFDTMTGTNQTAALVDKYSLTIDNPQSVTVDGHTVTVQAVIRSDTMARIIYDISGSRRVVRNFSSFRDAENRVISRIQALTNGQPSGHSDAVPGTEEVGYSQTRQSGPIGKVSESNAMRYYTDLDLTEGADSVSLYVLSEQGGAEVIQTGLPNPIPEKELTLQEPVSITYKGKESTVNCAVCKITVTPFRLTLGGTHDGQLLSLVDISADWEKLIHLYDENGREIKAGKNDSFYAGSGSLSMEEFTVELNSYDLIDPAEIAEIEINGIRMKFL